ncbi:MAG: 2-oxoacid:acceptor oxidoreductase subunit alpha [Anaerolineales bacterium]|jgi:2-oxoglutarate ferredoxin oxidoreductase subunit alpha|uniref:2-oxoacid:acceptor oxidoreductase subunit alpha n=1 Tax=Candidatus Villigracilis affinis TaxID=3140682 RepID=UPI001D64C07B|nr:2-oxoacid:acceptor oxidoreductase subunit alpha [Anaerolineales bacterium]MBK9602052.1 2-oxoacid:acceptor oxidoreductase subunit alpha [Anaerolineales bacterium]MBL0347864.1 2-oxoacid:acceptor oxidoreductase subunit alpha [Anaerolineales bacterium]
MNKIINDFSITVGTVNGSGSSTANNTILRSIFKMGIPVSGKNLFPSNIQGLPTWYTIRANKDGFIAHHEQRDIVIAMNPNSFVRDLASVAPGGAFFYADEIKQPITRTDIAIYPMPVKAIVKNDPNVPTDFRDLVGNMVYVGILAQMINLDMDKILAALTFHFKGKQKPIDMNYGAVKAGAEWAKGNLEKKDPYYVEAMNKTEGMIMADGNTAAALGSIFGGVQFAAWYPITPATSLAESLNDYLPQLRKREDGKHTYAVVQAEDELAALGMTVGAGWAGLRSMTSTSGPGLSLMTEFAGLAYYAETPVVIWDVQRIGPSTGLPTRTSQGDLTFTHFIGHGDSHSVILLPGDVFECFEFGWRAFDVAERIQTPVFVLSDLDMGMNQWMSKPFEYPETPMDRGKVLFEKDIEELKGNWGRYLDKDGDGIGYRTFPGNKHPLSSYFTRGTGHDEYAKYTEEADMYLKNMDRLKRKHETAKQYVPAPVLRSMKGATVGIIAFGSTEAAVIEAQYQLDKDHGIKTDFLRIRALPFTKEVDAFLAKYDQIFIVEMNRDGQMNQILLTEYPQFAHKFKSVAFGDGMPASAKWVREGILAKYTKTGTPKKAAVAKTASKAKAVSGSKKAAAKKPAVKKPVAKSKSSVKSKRK